MNCKENPFNQPYLGNKTHYNQYIMLSKRYHGVMWMHMYKTNLSATLLHVTNDDHIYLYQCQI